MLMQKYLIFLLFGQKTSNKLRIIMKFKSILVIAFVASISRFNLLYAQQKTRPNIIVILSDDMGYSDIGCFGSEIATPNLDKLAENGIRMSQFYNNARCCPTRASLLTGLYPHMAGIGWMTGTNMNLPGYQGELNDHCLTIAQVLKPAGYDTYALGKWHVAANLKDDGPKQNWPLQRGFDQYFGIIPGAANYFNPKGLTVGNTNIKADKNFYLTDAISDTSAKYIRQQALKKVKNPFFMYVAYTAAHWPLQAKQKDIKKYEDRYLTGWDNLRKERYAKQQASGLIDKSVGLNDRDAVVPAWKDIPESDRKLWAKRMAVYAAQIDCMDQGIGRIIKTLKENNLYDNTIIIYLADNGACAEFMSRNQGSIEELGTGKSYESYRINWANASNTPFKLYKHWVHEGGISTPCIISWPKHITNPGSINNTPTSIIDFMPTFMELSGAKYPSVFNGQKINPLPGRSFLPLLKAIDLPDRSIFWEHEANRAVRTKEWKLVSKGTTIKPYTGPWELYNMVNDRAEINNLAVKYPERVKEMAAMWNKWAESNNVFPLNGSSGSNRKDSGKGGQD